ncbi:hypothetical protein AAGS61_15280 [Lysinibacillus sp. KU-BSD001]|uniref:hypothetical protein n=1 Tax=Lysinibacillus sp. KU-BSD001 TaxID=3141328 RepID=UPI0036E72DE3
MTSTSIMIAKEAYEQQLEEQLLSVGILRYWDGKVISSRKLIENAQFFETEDMIYKEWFDSVYDSYHFYNGFDSLEECVAYISQSPYDNATYKIVRFLDMFYAVVYENTQHQQVVGKDVSYYTKNKLFLSSPRPQHSSIAKQRVRLPVIPLIYHELMVFDPNLRVYELTEAASDQFVEGDAHDLMSYIVLLGITFKDIWYPCTTPHSIAHSRAALNMYFNDGHDLMLFGKYVNAVAINPFQRLICFAKGRIEHFQMDIDDRKTPPRRLPYREVKRFHDMVHIRPLKEHKELLELI